MKRPALPGFDRLPTPAALAGMACAPLVALVGAALWLYFQFPLPWLVGSLCAVALVRVSGGRLLPLPGARQAGQWIIGTKMGLYFTSAVAAQVAAHALLIVGMALLSVGVGMLAAWVMVRLRLADAPTAFFASMPGGASEMANLSDQWQASVDLVAAAHAARVMLVVLVVPMALTFGGFHEGHGAGLATHPVDLPWLPPMALLGLTGMYLFRRLHLANGWLLGPLLLVGVCEVGHWMPLSGLPDGLSVGGQVLIGVSLGCRFRPGFLRRAPAFLGGCMLISAGFLGLTAGMAGLAARLSGLSFPNLVLSFSPGGIAEMSLTASHLGLGVALVVAAHVIRVAVLTLLAPHAFRLFQRFCP